MIYVLLVPAVLFFSVFFILPMIKLFFVGGSGELGWSAYAEALTNPNYVDAMIATFGVAAATTIATLIISGISGFFLQHHRFPGRRALVSMLTLPLAFPGVVVGFMIIMLAGRQGLIGQMSQALGAGKIVFAYSLVGLFLGYVYFSIPRTILTIMAATEKLDTRLEEAARSLGANALQRFFHIIIPNCRDGILAGSLMVLTLSIGEFNLTWLLHTPHTKTLPVGLADAYASMRLEVGSAYTLIFFLMIVPLLLAMQALARPRKRSFVPDNDDTLNSLPLKP